MNDVEKIQFSDFNDGGASGHAQAELPPDYKTATEGQDSQPVVPSAPPASVVIDQQPQLDPYPPKPVSADPNTTTTTTTTYVTVTDTDTDTPSRERSRYHDTYCPGFICCFFVPTPCPGASSPGGGNCNCIPDIPECGCLPNCNCLPPTTACCEGGFSCASLFGILRCAKGGDNPIIIIVILIILALILFALIGIIAFFFYRLGDDKIPAVAKRYRITAVVFACVGYTILIAAGIALAVVYA